MCMVLKSSGNPYYSSTYAEYDSPNMLEIPICGDIPIAYPKFW